MPMAGAKNRAAPTPSKNREMIKTGKLGDNPSPTPESERTSMPSWEGLFEGLFVIRLSWMGPLSFSPGPTESQDPLHLVPRDMSVGPEQSSDPRQFHSARTNKALPAGRAIRVC